MDEAFLNNWYRQCKEDVDRSDLPVSFGGGKYVVLKAPDDKRYYIGTVSKEKDGECFKSAINHQGYITFAECFMELFKVEAADKENENLVVSAFKSVFIRFYFSIKAVIRGGKRVYFTNDMIDAFLKEKLRQEKFWYETTGQV